MAGFTAVALVLATIAIARHHSAEPVLGSVEPGVGVGIPNDVGQDTTYGEIGLVAPGGQDISLLSAELVSERTEDGMKVVDVVAAEPNRGRVRVSSGDGFPTSDLQGKTRGLRGAHVPRPGDKDWQLGVELVFRLRASRVGQWAFSGVDVTYIANGQMGQQFIQAPLRFCAPLRSACQPPPLVPTEDVAAQGWRQQRIDAGSAAVEHDIWGLKGAPGSSSDLVFYSY